MMITNVRIKINFPIYTKWVTQTIRQVDIYDVHCTVITRKLGRRHLSNNEMHFMLLSNNLTFKLFNHLLVK